MVTKFFRVSIQIEDYKKSTLKFISRGELSYLNFDQTLVSLQLFLQPFEITCFEI